MVNSNASDIHVEIPEEVISLDKQKSVVFQEYFSPEDMRHLDESIIAYVHNNNYERNFTYNSESIDGKFIDPDDDKTYIRVYNIAFGINDKQTGFTSSWIGKVRVESKEIGGQKSHEITLEKVISVGNNQGIFEQILDIYSTKRSKESKTQNS